MIKKIFNTLVTFWNLIAITIILFVVLNILIWGVIVARNAPNSNDSELVATSYSADGKNDNRINLLIRESSAEQFVYEPFTQFKETPINNLHMNVSPHGFRSIENQGPWPINPNNVNIFVFGGSTIFGYGAADNQTIPSYLQELLRNQDENVSVYNFGRAYYYSTQERILFENLLNTGNIPDIVIFVNGLTDFFNYENIPALTKTLNNYNNSINHLVQDTIGRLPIIQLYNFASAKLTKKMPQISDQEASDNSLQAQKALKTFFNNERIIRAVSSEYNIQPFFVWQPTPFYNSFRKDDDLTGWLAYSRAGYELMNKKRLNNELNDNLIWLSNLDSDSADFIDLVHYSPDFSVRIAAAVSKVIYPYIEKIIKRKD